MQLALTQAAAARRRRRPQAWANLAALCTLRLNLPLPLSCRSACPIGRCVLRCLGV